MKSESKDASNKSGLVVPLPSVRSGASLNLFNQPNGDIVVLPSVRGGVVRVR